MEYLVSTTEVYRVDDEASAASLIEKAKHDSMYELAKYSSVKKEKKSKGEIVDEWYQVTLVKKFNDEKDPISNINVNYEVSF